MLTVVGSKYIKKVDAELVEVVAIDMKDDRNKDEETMTIREP